MAQGIYELDAVNADRALGILLEWQGLEATRITVNGYESDELGPDVVKAIIYDNASPAP